MIEGPTLYSPEKHLKLCPAVLMLQLPDFLGQEYYLKIT